MPIRGMSPEQLYETLVQAAGLRRESAQPAPFFRGTDSPHTEFVDKFASRDEKPSEHQTSILQVLTLMNGRLMADATSLKRGGTLPAVAESYFLDTPAKVEALYLAALTRRPRRGRLPPGLAAPGQVRPPWHQLHATVRRRRRRQDMVTWTSRRSRRARSSGGFSRWPTATATASSSSKEVDAYVERLTDAQGCRMMLTVTDRGQALFEIVDANGDQNLSVRDLRRAGTRLGTVDRNGDGRIARDEIPNHYRIGIGRGRAPIRRAFVVETYEAPNPAGNKGGSPWFEKMDRNRDGDISPREFLGSRDDFRRFDADGDGLIDPREAAKAP
jgi:Ca2+-binding EF-hand superfamily protein